MKYSIIFLVDEESEEFSGFFDLIHGLFEKEGEGFEVLVVANGTERFVNAQLNTGKNHFGRLRVITFPRKVPQPVCLSKAMSECNGKEVLTLGAFQELTPASYEKVVRAMTSGIDFVVPYRKNRKGPLLNRIHSRALNKAVRWMLGVELYDVGCNVRFFRREVLEGMQLYGNMYRYFPALAVQKGFKIKEIDCDQSEKARKTTYYSLELYLDRLIEILNLFFITKFSRKPLRFFNMLGTSLMLIGFLSLLYVGIQKVLFDVPIGARPVLMIGMVCLVGGAQLASFGLVGEIISFVHGRSRKEYTIEKVI